MRLRRPTIWRSSGSCLGQRRVQVAAPVERLADDAETALDGVPLFVVVQVRREVHPGRVAADRLAGFQGVKQPLACLRSS